MNVKLDYIMCITTWLISSLRILFWIPAQSSCIYNACLGTYSALERKGGELSMGRSPCLKKRKDYVLKHLTLSLFLTTRLSKEIRTSVPYVMRGLTCLRGE